MLVKLWSVHSKICHNNLKTRLIRTKVGPFLESVVVLNFDLIARCACLTYDLQNNYDNYCWMSNCFILRYSCRTATINKDSTNRTAKINKRWTNHSYQKFIYSVRNTHSDVDINIIYYNIDTMFHGFEGLSYFYEVV